MVRGQTTRKGRTTPRRSARPVAATRPTMPVAGPMTVADAQVRLDKVQRTAARFARSSTREVMTAAQALREPMQMMWRTLRRAGRNIARDVAAAWRELAPATMRKHAVASRKPA